MAAAEGLPNANLYWHPLSVALLGNVTTKIFEFPEEENEQLREVITFVKGQIVKHDNPLIRIQSRCLYGEVFDSLECDCKDQLLLSQKMIFSEGKGIIFYLNQEGRGAGIIKKAQAYSLQAERGLDTVEAFKSLGISVDGRDYSAVARILLNHFQVTKIRLLTNNPGKADSMAKEGLSVTRVPLQPPSREENIEYLKIKKLKMGHKLTFK